MARWKRARQWVNRHLPMFRGTCIDQTQDAARKHNSELNRVRDRHATELEAAEAKVDASIRRLSDIQFERVEQQHGRYRVSVTFDSRMLSGPSMYDDELRFVAHRVAREIEHEIASSKFVRSAADLEAERMEHRYRNMPTFLEATRK